ncbi:MAG: hypothetical protein IH921_09105 [Gemmatimonadetes bacterium]|nr:hypothetical protein [Gemmatimonadota bacterium]
MRHLREGSFKFDPNVTRVTQPGQDPLEPLLAVGWQATSEPEDSASGSAGGAEER